MKDLRKLADQVLDKQKINKYRNLFIDAMLSFHEQASRDTKERLKIQIDLNDKLLLELKESTQRIIELENELNELIDS